MATHNGAWPTPPPRPRSTAGNRITVNPVPSLARNTLYRVTLTGGTSAVRDVVGNPLASTTITFRTRP